MSEHTYHAELYRKKYEDYIATLKSNIQTLEEKIARLEKLVAMGRDFQVILDAVNSDDLVKHHWDKMLMTMRLRQDDQ